MLRTIILSATQRCGSTHIVEDMRNSGVLGNLKEWFISWDTANSKVNWHDQLVGVIERASDSTGISAIKVMANQLPNIDRCLSGELKPTAHFDHFFDAFAGSVWVNLVRGNVVYQAISRIMARQIGINHASRLAGDEHFAGNLINGYIERSRDNHNENLVWQDFFE